jgi:di/tricarboxylate transporter
MRHIRFSIASLLVVVLFVAVGFAALREASDLWDSGVFTLTFAALLISILLSVHRTESRRAFWIGFALFGWTYLWFSLVPSIESRLMTRKALA